MTIVIDSSYAMAVTLPDETPPSSHADVLQASLIAPHLFPVEVANAALNSVRRRRYLPEDIEKICRSIESLDIEVMSPIGAGASYHARFAFAHGLSAYDGMYLDLALTRRCALATADARLADAARRVGVEVLT